MRAAAGRLEHQAGWLPTSLDRAVAGSGPLVWRGPAADRFDDELRRHRSTLGSSADELRAIARRLYQQADALERRMADDTNRAKQPPHASAGAATRTQ